MIRVLLLLVTIAVIAFIAAATVNDIIHHGFSWIDGAALLIVLLFATGILGALWDSIRRD